MKRVKGIRTVFLVLLLVLAARLCYVQIFCEEELTAAAFGQQMIPVVQQSGRGTIYDRNMIPMTGSESAYYYLLPKDRLTPGAEHLLERMGAEPAGQKGTDYLIYRAASYFPVEHSLLQKRHQAYGFSVDERYVEKQTALSLIMDLDQMYDGLLQRNESSFYFLGNAGGGMIHGMGMHRAADSGGTGGGLVTTIDMELQQNLEFLFDETEGNGCAVVTDTSNGQILAMVSKRKATEKHEADAEHNLAVEQAYPLGKAYRIIGTAAEAAGRTYTETAMLAGMGQKVFDGYPDEAAGTLSGTKTTVTAVQMSQILVMLANDGDVVPLTLVMSTMKEESIPCMGQAGDTLTKLKQLHDELTGKPLTGDGWAVGYLNAYAVVVYLEDGNPQKLYRSFAEYM